MRLVHPGQMILPLILIALGALLVMGRFDIIRISQYREFWPVSIIALGVEELYLWTRKRDGR